MLLGQGRGGENLGKDNYWKPFQSMSQSPSYSSKTSSGSTIWLSSTLVAK